MNQQVLVLNGDYQPLNITNLHRALGLVLLGKAEILEEGDGNVRSATRRLPEPLVIRLGYFIRRPHLPVRLSRRALFARDGYRCMYCGTQDRQLTIDHVVPRAKGGLNTWENLVTACKRCNNLKGGRPLDQTGLKLRHPPKQPHFILPNSYPALVNQELDERWLKYLHFYLPRTTN